MFQAHQPETERKKYVVVDIRDVLRTTDQDHLVAESEREYSFLSPFTDTGAVNPVRCNVM